MTKHTTISSKKRCIGERSGQRKAKHLLIEVGNVFEVAGIRNPDHEEFDISPEGYICTCGNVLGVKNGKLVPICKLETR